MSEEWKDCWTLKDYVKDLILKDQCGSTEYLACCRIYGVEKMESFLAELVMDLVRSKKTQSEGFQILLKIFGREKLEGIYKKNCAEKKEEESK